MALTADSVHRQLMDAAQKWRFAKALRFILAGVAIAFGQMLVFFALDSWLHFGAAMRWSTFSLIAGTFLAGLVGGWRAWAPKISAASMARHIEKATGDSSNVLISAVQFADALPARSPLRQAIYQEMRDPFPGIRWDAVFDTERLKKWGWALGAAVLALLAWALLHPAHFLNAALRIVLPSSSIQPLTRTRIDAVLPGNDTVTSGHAVPLRVVLSGQIPKSAWIRFRESGGSWKRQLLEHEVGQTAFTYEWKNVTESFDYQVEAGDATSGVYAVRVRPRTLVKGREAVVTPPAYTGLPEQQLKDFTALTGVLPGTQVQLTLSFNNPVKEMTVTTEKGAALPVRQVSENAWAADFTASESGKFRISFRDEADVLETAVLPFALAVDDPPKILISEPVEGRELFAEKGAQLNLKFAVTDNFALGSVALVQSSSEQDDARVLKEWPEVAGKAQLDASATVDVQPIGEQTSVTFRVIAKDQNDVSGPGVTVSRPIVVSLKAKVDLAEERKKAEEKVEVGLEDAIRLQEKNLEDTKIALTSRVAGPLDELVNRQTQISDILGGVISSGEGVSAELRDRLVSVRDHEMKDAVVQLREAGGGTEPARGKALSEAVVLQSAILAKIKGAPEAAQEDAKRAEVTRVVSALEELFKQQREIFKDTKANGSKDYAKLSERQDSLADRVPSARKGLEADSRNSAIGDEDFRKRLVKIVELIGTAKIYEGMLSSAEDLQGAKVDASLKEQSRVLEELAKMVEMLNDWQKKSAEQQKEDLKEKLENLNEALKNLTDVQKDIVEKTKEMARKTEFRPDDVAQMDELKKTKDLVKEAVEQMAVDLQVFMDTAAGNQMRDLMMQVFEDVQQSDLEDVLAGKLKMNEVAITKGEDIAETLAKMKELSADTEAWLSPKNNPGKFMQENNDKTEFDGVPKLGLADAFEDLVGELLKEQENLAEEAGTATNQVAADAPPGWDVGEGPIAGFGAQGKSGNTAPKHNEQTGRSSGGREGMSNGEMAGSETQTLKGDTPDARRTNDAMQQGQVRDNGEVGKVRATGGGKSGGFSDRVGMEGNAPVKAVNAERKPADVVAAEQAILAEKTAKKVAEAKMLYIKSDGLRQVAALQAQAATALKEGRGRDALGLHQRVIRQLQELQGGVSSSTVVSQSTSTSVREEEKKRLGGNESEAPQAYKAVVADYFRSLVEDK